MRCSCAGAEPGAGVLARARRAVAAAGLAAAAATASATPLPTGTVSWVDVEHVVQPGDSLTRVGARHGVAPALVARDNALPADARLRVGQRLQVRSVHLLPQPLADTVGDGVLINAAQRMLWLLRGGNVVAAHPVTVGRPDWPTPLGAFSVTSRMKDKTWFVPKSIQDEMRELGQPVLTQVPPGPDNPLGGVWIGTSLPAIGLHGTNAPASIYGYRSHGCVRLHTDDARALYDRVAVGDAGRIAYQSVLWLQADDGAIWFEAHPDPYRRDAGPPLAALRAQADAAGVAERIEWSKVTVALRQRDGQARRVDRPAGAGGQSTP